MSSLELGHLIEAENKPGKPVRLKMPAGEGFQMTIIGGSGSGKTHTLYRIVEHIPQTRPIFIADVEQDFLALRKHRDFVIVGKNRDLPADPTIAEMLAKQFLELRFSIIFDAFEERKKDRELFLKNFLQTLHDAPRKLWQPATILLDELDTWAPEHGVGESLCTEACANAAKRFRKRHFDLIMATQRPSDVDKTVISQSRNMLIGLANIDTDVKRSLSFLGFTEKEERKAYRDLQRGEWFARGPEMDLRHPHLMKVGTADLYNKAEAKAAAERPPAPKGDVKKLLSSLKNLPQEAKEELQDREAMKARIRELERELKAKPAGVDPKEKNNWIALGAQQERTKIMKTMHQYKNRLQAELQRLTALVEAMPVEAEAKTATAAAAGGRAVHAPAPAAPRLALVSHRRQESGNSEYGRCERAVLGFLLMKQGQSFTKAQVGAMTGYAQGSGGFNNSLSKLAQAGLIVRINGSIMLNEAAAAEATTIVGNDTPHRLEDWIGKLGACERAVYSTLLQDPTRKWSKDEIAQETQYSAGSGGFNNALSRLSTLGLMKRHHDGAISLNPEINGL